MLFPSEWKLLIHAYGKQALLKKLFTFAYEHFMNAYLLLIHAYSLFSDAYTLLILAYALFNHA